MPLSKLPWPDYLDEYMQAPVACCIGLIIRGATFKPEHRCKRPYLVGINDVCDVCGNNLMHVTRSTRT